MDLDLRIAIRLRGFQDFIYRFMRGETPGRRVEPGGQLRWLLNRGVARCLTVKRGEERFIVRLSSLREATRTTILCPLYNFT